MALNFDQLPPGFTASKPIDLRETQFSQVKTWLKQGTACLQRKRDGLRHYISIGPKGAHILSRKGQDMTAHFPDIALRLGKLPIGTILDAELVPRRDGDDWEAITGICNSAPSRAQALQRATPVRFLVFDVLYLTGKPSYKMRYFDRYTLSSTIVKMVHRKDTLGLMAILPPNLDNAVADVAKHQWEGLIVWRLDQATLVKTEGSPSRTGCYRWKPLQDDDFIAYKWTPGEGDAANMMGALHLCQYTKKGQKDYGRVGSGFTDKERVEAMSWQYPCVVQVRYQERDDTTGSLRFPVFVRKRYDKNVS